MSYLLPDLDAHTRARMLSEFNADLSDQSVYRSAAVFDTYMSRYFDAHERAFADGSPESMAAELAPSRIFKPTNARGARINPVAQAKLIAGGQFGAYYARAVCLRGIEAGREIEIYRARESRSARPESLAKIGTRPSPDGLLEDLRTHSGDPFRFAILPEVGSGLNVRLV